MLRLQGNLDQRKTFLNLRRYRFGTRPGNRRICKFPDHALPLFLRRGLLLLRMFGMSFFYLFCAVVPACFVACHLQRPGCHPGRTRARGPGFDVLGVQTFAAWCFFLLFAAGKFTVTIAGGNHIKTSFGPAAFIVGRFPVPARAVF